MVLHPSSIADRDLPRLAIRPYPHVYIREVTDETGTPIVIRPIRPEDEPAMIRFHGTLSEETVRARYGSDLALAERTAHERLTRICFVDYDREIALVAEAPIADGSEVAGVVRLSRIHVGGEHELSLVVADPWQRHGIGRELLRSVIAVARGEGARGIYSRLSPENHAMRALLTEAGFTFAERGELLVASLATS